MSRSEFIDFVRPPGDRLKLYDKSRRSNDQPVNDAADPTKQIPQGFLDAMAVREQVYIDEQHCSLENELDDDDKRSFHWTAYASIPAKSTQSTDKNPTSSSNGPSSTTERRTSSSTKIPIGTIRLVPPPHEVHPHGRDDTSVHDGKEPYIKLGRLAVTKEFRKAGISRLLIETALAFARDHPRDITGPLDPTLVEALKQEHSTDLDFRGLVLVHAQVGVQKVWRKYGFETDESMGQWVEEGIDHVGMWKRMDIKGGRRASRMLAA